MKITVLTGAGISAESGIKTFRDAGGLWEGHDIMEVASPQAWRKNPQLVLEFYNIRRRQLHTVQPNAAHTALTELERKFDVQIITQNVDDLHERAGSSRVLHLHGELFKARSTRNPELVYDHRGDLQIDDRAENGAQLRPHIVWFGEPVPLLVEAAVHFTQAAVVLVIGTSLQVYPAAGLIGQIRRGTPVFYIDPRPHISPEMVALSTLTPIAEKASIGVPQVCRQLLSN